MAASTNVGPGHDLRCFTAETANTDHLDEAGWFDGLRPLITGCNDGLDNDHDGNVDRSDPECRRGASEIDATIGRGRAE